jgi:hypothetical protein
LVLRHRNPDVFPGPPTTAFSGGLWEHEANVAIVTGEVIDGHLPRTAARLVKQWTLAHRDELQANWNRARARLPLDRIAGLDDDQGIEN